MIELGIRPLLLADVVDVASGNSGARLAPAARERMRAGRAVVERAVAEGRVVYGVTTGFGELKDRHIPAADTRMLQLNLVPQQAARI